MDPDLPHLVGDFTTSQFNVNSEATQPLAFPVFDPTSVILTQKCIIKKSPPEPETEYIHFVDTKVITDNEDFFKDETEEIELDSLHNLNPELGDLEPLNVNTLAHPDPSLLKDIPLDKVCIDDIKLISKETDQILSALKLNLEDSDLFISPTKLTPNNSELILNNYDGDVDNLELEVIRLNLLPNSDHDLVDPESIDLRAITKPDPIEIINMNLEDSSLNLNDSEPNWKNEPTRVLLESILGVAPLDLCLKEGVFLNWTYLTIPRTDFNVKESLSPYFHVTSLTVVPTSVMDTLPHFLSLIPVGDYFRSCSFRFMFERGCLS
ncbi:hypothetical protein IEQ34_013475 [Dendrobium chrysotoxum]|uniref:Uncharacterized protein n=1 Tax=Dendrobium chrysotoxum TaxID=161865 RepID=A0AAV7G8Z3_DENCH|nr:hypothetical protein IEQ34_013475 [Dendrobium chrysotoxum]